jgi:hypothetical protein
LLAQTDSTISFVAYWNKGDSKEYRITKKQIQIRNDVETKNQSTVYDIKCTVIDSTSTSYTIEWAYDNSVLNSIEIPQEFNETIEKYKVLKIIYTTDELGAFQDIINWEEIRDLMNELLNKIPEMVSDHSDTFKNALKPIKDLYASKEGIASLILKEIQIFHYPMGLEFNAIDTLFYEESLPNMLGGTPIRGNGELYFENVDREQNLCTFINKLELDSTDSKRVIVDLMNRIISNTGYNSIEEREKAIEEMNAEFSNMNMDIKDAHIFIYRYYPGWPININTKRISEISSREGKGYRIDEIIIDEL